MRNDRRLKKLELRCRGFHVGFREMREGEEAGVSHIVLPSGTIARSDFTSDADFETAVDEAYRELGASVILLDADADLL